MYINLGMITVHTRDVALLSTPILIVGMSQQKQILELRFSDVCSCT